MANLDQKNTASRSWLAWAGIVTPTAISIIAAVMSGYYALRVADTQSGVEFVKLAVTLIRDKDTSVAQREWAVDIMARYTDVPLTEDRKKALAGAIAESGGVEPTPMGWQKLTNPQAAQDFQALVTSLGKNSRYIEMGSTKPQ